MLTHKFRLYPNKEQEERLGFALEMCRQTYNNLLGELQNQTEIDRNVIQDRINDLKIVYPDLKKVHSKTLQYECYRLFSNLSALSALKKKKKKVGSLRFKGKGWFKTINYNQTGFKVQHTYKNKGRLVLSKIGNIKVKMNRFPEGQIKQVTIKKTLGKWEAHLVCDEKKEIKSGNENIGIDLGINAFYTDNKGNKIKHPKTYENYQPKLRKEQKNLSRKKKGSNNRKKQKKRLAKLHQRIERKRTDFLHKESTKLIKRCNKLFVEDLNIKNMTEQKYWNAKNISDSSWNKFLQMLEYKAENAGISLVKVNPKNTTKRCSSCGHEQPMPYWKRTYECESCGLVLDRDLNASKNILIRGLGQASVENSTSIPLEHVGSEKQEAIS